jgi:hypothetical protein
MNTLFPVSVEEYLYRIISLNLVDVFNENELATRTIHVCLSSSGDLVLISGY